MIFLTGGWAQPVDCDVNHFLDVIILGCSHNYFLVIFLLLNFPPLISLLSLFCFLKALAVVLSQGYPYPLHFVSLWLHHFLLFFFLTGISSVLFESRIGCLDPVVPEETERFIQSINTMFVMTLLTMAMPSWLHQLFPKPWNVFCKCWDYMFDFGR